jgi:hypothetical protein
MRLTRLQLQNFKACRQVDLQLAPLTVLIGANNAGKSSILHSIALQAQSAPGGGVQSVGTLVDLGPTVDALVHRESRDTPPMAAEIRLNWADIDGQPPIAGFAMQIGARGEVSSGLRVELDLAAGGRASLQTDRGEVAVTIEESGQTTAERVPANSSLWASLAPARADQSRGVQVALQQAGPYFQQFAVEALRRFRYVGANRHVESSVFPLGTRAAANPRTAQELVDTLAYNDELLSRVSERCQAIFGYSVDKDLIENRQITIVAIGPGVRRNVVNLGTGFIQTVWLLTLLELALAQPPSEAWSITPLVGIEEPELHIHPGLQPGIARLLGAFVRAGLDLICTTQSEHLLLALLSLVLEGELTADQIVVYYLRDGEAARLVVDEQGRIEGGLRGFFEANEEQLRRHIELLKYDSDDRPWVSAAAAAPEGCLLVTGDKRLLRQLRKTDLPEEHGFVPCFVTDALPVLQEDRSTER